MRFSFLAFFFILAALYASRRLFARALSRRPFDPARERLCLALFLSCALILRVTLFSADGFACFSPPDVPLLNLVPLSTAARFVKNRRLFFLNVVCNVLLFVPFGALLPFFFSKRKVAKTVLCSFLLSLFVESLQLLLPDRFTDVDDLIFNTLGGASGALIFLFFRALRRK